MYERFTQQTRQVVYELAFEEARMLGHHFVGSEHLLLGLMHEDGGPAFTVLQATHRGRLEIQAVRAVVLAVDTGLEGSPEDEMTFTSDAVRALAQSEREPLYHGQSDITPVHLLVGLLRLGGMHAQVLEDLDVNAEVLRSEALDVVRSTL